MTNPIMGMGMGTMGTSIQDLNKKDKGEYYDNMRNLQNISQINYNTGQGTQFDNLAQNMQQAQQLSYHNIPNAGEYPQFNSPTQSTQSIQQYPQRCAIPKSAQKEIVDIEELAKDINDSLGEDTFASVNEGYTDDSTGLNLFSNIPPILREGSLILILFIILSLPVVKDNIGHYIKQINPDTEGKVSMSGIVIYGIILAVLYMLINKYLL